MERDAFAQVLDAVELLRRGAADHAVDLVPLLEQQLGEVGAVLAGDSGDQRALVGHQVVVTPCWSRSHCAVCSMPSRTPIRASQSSRRLAFSTDGQRRLTSTSNVGRCSNDRSAGSLPAASQQIAAISATVSSSLAEMLKSSLSPASAAVATTMPSAMSSTCVSVRVCSPEPKI